MECATFNRESSLAAQFLIVAIYHFVIVHHPHWHNVVIIIHHLLFLSCLCLDGFSIKDISFLHPLQDHLTNSDDSHLEWLGNGSNALLSP